MSQENISNQYQVFEKKPDHHYHTQIPNLVFELGLSPFELAVYLVLKKIAGDSGYCSKKKVNLAHDCRMSETALKKCIKSLKEKRELLGNQPLIKVVEQLKKDGSPDVNIITITPIWRLNGDFFNEKGGASRDPGVGRHAPEGGSPNARKEERLKKNLFKKNDNVRKDPSSPPIPAEQDRDRSFENSNSSIVPFDPFTYRLPNGQLLSSRCAKAFIKYKGDDKAKLMANISYFEEKMAKPNNDGIRNQEAYLQKCINENYAKKQELAWQNSFYASWVIAEYKITKFKKLKTVLEITIPNEGKTSIKFDMPTKEFEHRLKYYLKNCFNLEI